LGFCQRKPGEVTFLDLQKMAAKNAAIFFELCPQKMAFCAAGFLCGAYFLVATTPHFKNTCGAKWRFLHQIAKNLKPLIKPFRESHTLL
jgi:hypothetical protein